MIEVLETEIVDSVRAVLSKHGVEEPHIRIRARTRNFSMRVPIASSEARETAPIVGEPGTRVNLVRIRVSIDFVEPSTD